MSEMNYDRLLKMAEFINKHKQKQQPSGENAGNVCLHASELDKRLNTPELTTIKSAIPLLEPGYQRLMSITVKFIEIQRLLDYLRETADAIGRINSRADEDKNAWRIEMLELIKPHLSPDSRSQLDTFISFMQIASTFNEEL